jgi:uncharacterized protein (TIGR02001 family)
MVVLIVQLPRKGNAMRKTKIFVIAMCAVFAIPAMAADAASTTDSSISYNWSIASDYVFRGITQTTHAPAVQGGVDYALGSGLYVGTWASNVKWIKDSGAIASGDSSVELDAYFGFKDAIVEDLGYDLGYVRYNYLGSYTPQANFNNADTAEIYGAASYKLVTLKYSYSLLDGFLTTPGARGSNYVDLSANYPVAETGLTIGAHIGKQTVVGASADSYALVGNAPTYTDYKLSAAKDFGSYVLSLSYTNTNASSFWAPSRDPWGKAATSVSLTHSF